MVYARKIPDDGTYWHLGKKVSKRVTGGRPNEHPEVNKPTPPKRLTRGERSALRDMREVAARGELVDMYSNPIGPSEVTAAYRRRDVIKKGVPRRP